MKSLNYEYGPEVVGITFTGKLPPTTPTTPSAQSILMTSVDEMKDRAAKRDNTQGERSMARTVNVFNTLTGNQLTEEQGWLFMVCLKLARGSQGAFHLDDYVDAAAYCALQGEAAAKQAVTLTK